MDYRLLISIEVVEFLERIPSRTRKNLRDAIAAIGGDPFAMTDAADFDDTGRQLQIAIIGDFALTYWIDDDDRHVKIPDIHAADR
jgi:mRNA-degrading endonuclease RelE of RelBE toxin-antitoxin system